MTTQRTILLAAGILIAFFAAAPAPAEAGIRCYGSTGGAPLQCDGTYLECGLLTGGAGAGCRYSLFYAE